MGGGFRTKACAGEDLKGARVIKRDLKSPNSCRVLRQKHDGKRNQKPCFSLLQRM